MVFRCTSDQKPRVRSKRMGNNFLFPFQLPSSPSGTKDVLGNTFYPYAYVAVYITPLLSDNYSLHVVGKIMLSLIHARTRQTLSSVDTSDNLWPLYATCRIHSSL